MDILSGLLLSVSLLAFLSALLTALSYKRRYTDEMKDSLFQALRPECKDELKLQEIINTYLYYDEDET